MRDDQGECEAEMPIHTRRDMLLRSGAGFGSMGRSIPRLGASGSSKRSSSAQRSSFTLTEAVDVNGLGRGAPPQLGPELQPPAPRSRYSMRRGPCAV